MAAPFPVLRRLIVVMFALAALSALAADETGQPAPRFRAKTTAGDQFNNASIKGKVVLFEFWTTWCKYCEEEASMVDDVAKEFSGKGLVVLAVDVLEPKKKVQKYLIEHPRAVPIVLTEETNLAAMYNAQSYPIYVVIDRDGNIAGEQRGAAGERGRSAICCAGRASNRTNPTSANPSYGGADQPARLRSLWRSARAVSMASTRSSNSFMPS